MREKSFLVRFVLCLSFALAGMLTQNGFAQVETDARPATPAKIRVLIVDGQNNHAIWPKTTEMMRSYLLESERFQVDIARTEPKGPDPNFAPDFSKYDVVLSNYNGEAWPEATRNAFEEFVKKGGGFVVIHAANNAFPEWREYNRMIGLGGWGGRSEKDGPYVYYDEQKRLQRDEAKGAGGSHGPQHEFIVQARNSEHPIMAGLPERWLHTQDELYDRLRGPGENLEVLATSFAAPDQGGTGRHEPMVMVVNYEQGRIFHTTLGHADYSQECVGFITLLLRGTEWAATGKVTIPIPPDFPNSERASRRPPKVSSNVKRIFLGNTINPTQFENIIFAGAIDPNDAELFRQTGIRTIISLCKQAENDWDESEWAQREGFSLHQLPCGFPIDLPSEQLEQISEILSKASPDHQILFHCGQGGRVGACWAILRTLHQGAPLDEALREAAAIGLRTEPMIKSVRERILKEQQ